MLMALHSLDSSQRRRAGESEGGPHFLLPARVSEALRRPRAKMADQAWELDNHAAGEDQPIPQYRPVVACTGYVPGLSPSLPCLSFSSVE